MSLENKESPQTIYVISQGSYSDYHICGVTTDPVRAEELRKFYTDQWDEAEIEEYEDGAPEAGELSDLKPIWLAAYHADLKGGFWKCKLAHYTNENKPNEYGMSDPKLIRNIGDLIFKAYVNAPDEDHALKIAQDQYAKMKAERLGL